MILTFLGSLTELMAATNSILGIVLFTFGATSHQPAYYLPLTLCHLR
jgi:hypothetical protein